MSPKTDVAACGLGAAHGAVRAGGGAARRRDRALRPARACRRWRLRGALAWPASRYCWPSPPSWRSGDRDSAASAMRSPPWRSASRCSAIRPISPSRRKAAAAPRHHHRSDRSAALRGDWRAYARATPIRSTMRDSKPPSCSTPLILTSSRSTRIATPQQAYDGGAGGGHQAQMAASWTRGRRCRRAAKAASRRWRARRSWAFATTSWCGSGRTRTARASTCVRRRATARTISAPMRARVGA